MEGPLTISYSNDVQGWTSFWTFIPEYMVFMSNEFYSFRDGNLYIHNKNPRRTVFYPNATNTTPNPSEIPAECSIRTVFNQSPIEAKLFKTVSYQSNDTWSANLNTDMISGIIYDSWFDLKENAYYGYIRRNSNLTGTSLTNISQLDDSKSSHILGIGEVLSVNILDIEVSGYDGQNISNISEPDQLYSYNDVNGNLVYIGDISSGGNMTISMINITNVPSVGDKLLAIKKSVQESYGARGYFLDVTLRHNKESYIELFQLGSSVFKSFM